MSSKLEELSKDFEKVKFEIVNKAKENLNEAFKECFEAYPNIKIITWNQYIPYFNDGGAFIVNDFYASNNSNLGEIEDEEDNDFVVDSYNDKEYELIWDIEKFAQSSLGEELFQITFGEHSEVSVTKDGIEILECDHD